MYPKDCLFNNDKHSVTKVFQNYVVLAYQFMRKEINDAELLDTVFWSYLYKPDLGTNQWNVVGFNQYKVNWWCLFSQKRNGCVD
jgi:hypothetical protein